MYTASCISALSQTQSKPRYVTWGDGAMGKCILTRHNCHYLGFSLLSTFYPSWLSLFIWSAQPTTLSGFFIPGMKTSKILFNDTHILIWWNDTCRMNALRRLLHGCQRISSSEYSQYSEYSHTTTVQAAPSGDRPKIRLDLYFDKKSMDFGLLMDLLAEASGLVQSLRWSEKI